MAATPNCFYITKIGENYSRLHISALSTGGSPPSATRRYWHARITDRFIRCRFRFHSNSVVFTNYDQFENTICEHPRKASLPFADGQCLLRIIPMDWDRRIDAPLVVVGVILVFVQDEIGIGAGIDAQFDGICGFLIRPLFVRPNGNIEPART